MKDKTVITTAITSQILESVIAMEAQTKAEITIDLSAEVTKKFTLSPVELEENPKRLSQSPMKDNNVFKTTPMEVDTDIIQINEPSASEEPVTTIKVTPTRNFRPQKHRGIAGTLKKTLKKGQTTDYKK